MRGSWIRLIVMLMGILAIPALAGPFVLFPKAGQLASPDGRYVVRNAGREASAAEFAGTFNALWLDDSTTGKSRKLCDYVGVAAVAWSGNEFLLVTQYLGKKTSRALILSVARPEDSAMLDVPSLIRLVPAELRPALQQNDHVFVEASSLEGGTFHLRVWGYGKRDPDGFRWACQYQLREGVLTCTAEHAAK